MRALSLLPLVLGALAGSAAAGAQEARLAVDDLVTVNVVEVDVVVTDRDGDPVRGLGREAFRLFEDGAPVELSNFLEYVDRRPRLGAAIAASPAPEEPAVGEEPAAGEPVTVVLYFDNTSLVPAHRNRVLPDVRQFVERASAAGGTRFMVATFDPGLGLVAPPTADAEVVSAALDRVAGMPARGVLAERDRRSARDHVRAIYKEVESSKGYGPLEGEPGPGNRRAKPSAATLGYRGRFFDPCEEAWPSMLNAVDTFALAQLHRVESSQTGLRELTRSLIAVPGKKVVLYLSDGLAQVPGMLEYRILGQLCPDREHELFSYYARFERSAALEEVTALANLHRVSFYALDTTGLGGISAASAESDDQRFTPTFQADSDHRENLRASLYTLAERTGGLAFFNANRPGPELERMASDYSDYYSLGFDPPAGWDGEVHRLEVKLAKGVGDGYRLRYRRQYLALPRQERIAERTVAALVLGLEDNPLAVELRWQRPSRLEDGRYLLPLEISLDLDRLTTTAAGDRRHSQLRLVLAVQGDDGELAPLRERVVPLELPALAAAGSRHSLILRLPLQEGARGLALAVEDRLAGVISYVRSDIHLGPGKARDSG